MNIRERLTACLLLTASLLTTTCRTVETEHEDVPELHDYRVDVDFMHPRRWSSRSVRDYWVVVRNDSLECHLPYMGVQYQADFYNEGLNFRVPIASLRQGRGRKGQVEATLTFRRNTTGYRLTVILFPGGKASLYLTPSNGDPISYDGEWQGL